MLSLELCRYNKKKKVVNEIEQFPVSHDDPTILHSYSRISEPPLNSLFSLPYLVLFSLWHFCVWKEIRLVVYLQVCYLFILRACLCTDATKAREDRAWELYHCCLTEG